MRRITALIAALLILTCAAGCLRENSDRNGEGIVIAPENEPDASFGRKVRLYFAEETGSYLVSETREIPMLQGKRNEFRILEELINGPSNREMYALINPDTKVVDVVQSEETVTVTFSADFLNAPSATDRMNAELVVYSVANTLIEATGVPYVQILVDRDGTGVGQRFRIIDFYVSSSSNAFSLLGPVQRNSDLILDPKNAVGRIFDAVNRKDYAACYSYLSSETASDRPSMNSFITSIEKKDWPLEEYRIKDGLVSDDGKSAVVTVNYTLRISQSRTLNRTNIPVFVNKINGIWRMDYPEFEKLFFDVSG